MKLQVNGEPMQLPDGLCLEALIRRLEMPAERVAAMIGDHFPRRTQVDRYGGVDGVGHGSPIVGCRRRQMQ